jgi:hypothetical protein
MQKEQLMRTFFWLSILLGVFACAPARAQGQSSACTDDAYRLCEAQIPVKEDIAACLRAHASQLSPGCKKEFARAAKSKRHGGHRSRAR